MQNSQNMEVKWGTPTPIVFNDVKYGQIKFSVFGTCNCFLNNANYNQEEVNNLIQTETNNCIQTILSEISDKSFEDAINEIKSKLMSNLNMICSNFNIVIQDVQFGAAKLTDESLKKMQEYDMAVLKKKQNEPTIVQTDVGAKDGQNKCPKCGATEITLNVATGKLKCRYCRCEFEPEKVSGLDGDISQLQGQVMGSGATDIVADTNDVLTFKCSSCGAEVVVDTATSTQSRCHWCRNTLSVNQQIPNGSVPDVVLPFGVTKDDAKLEIEKFVRKRKFFANPKFSKEFTTDNIMGVYFPYMVVDVNSHANLSGQGEKLVRTYTRGSSDNRKTYYDADLYDVSREFDLTIDDLTIESSFDRLNNSQSGKTNNVINAIMPFDTENCVKWNANYLKGYTSEKRDVNTGQLSPLIETQVKDIARFSANQTIKEYDRGVVWSNEQITVKGQQWKSAYLPVWLYSYQQVNGSKQILHYVAVNARTKETMGSIPIHMPKLLLYSFLIEILGVLLMLFVDFDYSYLFLSLGFIFFIVMFLRYRNSNARHKHEVDTKSNMSSITGNDTFIQHRTGLSNSRMQGSNNTSVNGSTNGNSILNAMNADNLTNKMVDTITSNNVVASMIKDNIDRKNN